MSGDGADDVLRTCIEQLQRPVVDVQTLLSALCPPLEALGVLPTKFAQYVDVRVRPASRVTARHITRIQSAILEHVLPAWETELEKQHLGAVLGLWLCPVRSEKGPGAGTIAVEAYASLLSLPITTQSLPWITRLVDAYPIEAVHSIIFDHVTTDISKAQLRWEDAVRVITSVPAKAANALGTLKLDLPPPLKYGRYMNRLFIGVEQLIHEHCRRRSKASAISISSVFTKLSRLGAFPSSAPSLASQTSYFSATLPNIRNRLEGDGASDYTTFWSTLLLAVGSTTVTQSMVTSLIGHLTIVPLSLGASTEMRRVVKQEAQILRKLTGDGDQDLVETMCSVALAKDWNEGHARVIVCSLSESEGTSQDEALGILWEQTVEVWTSPTHVKHSLLSKHRYLTCLLLLTLCSFQSPTRVQELAFDPAFIESIGHYLGAADHAVRRCGMLAAEVVATKAGKKLDFGEWEGDEPGKQWARELRALIQTRDIDVIIHSDVEEATSSAPVPATVEEDSDDEEPPPHPSAKSRPSALNSNHGCDSDDSLTGYASSSSSRSPSPTPSELEEIEKDPTLAVGVKKIARPVYLAQLGELLRPTTISQGDDPNEADRLEMGLGCAEELIRRKRAYGSELAENAVNLVHALLALNNNFDLDNFDERRQAGLTALVACCPTRAAPSIVEEFFRNQYSGEQRAAMLNALALGARELAGLPVPASSVDPGRIAFPSKRLPPALERRYIAAMDHVTAHPPVHGLLEDITRGVIAKTTAPGGSEPPQIARERQLQIRPLAKVVPLPAPVASQTLFQAPTPTQAPQTTFGSVAAEYFVYPLIARFWTFLRDEQTREARTAALPPAHQYRSAGTGLLLSAPVLAQFVATLGVLLHAARLSPAWGAVLAPQAMELALAIGARRISLLDGEEDAREGSDTQVQSAHALVGAAALELALVVLDGSVDLDAGRALALEHTALLRGVGDWATSIFSSLEKGERAKGGGGALEIRLVRAAAGVCVKVEEVGQRWGRSMIQM